jgi:hypothetical protein
MSEWHLRVVVGIYLIAVQSILLGLSAYYLSTGGLLFQQFTTIAGLIVPLFAGYLSVIVKFFASHRFAGEIRPGHRMTAPFTVLSFFFPTIFAIAIGGCIVAAAHNIILRDFDDVKVAISVGQAAFGVYIGQFLYSLFEATPETTYGADRRWSQPSFAR